MEKYVLPAPKNYIGAEIPLMFDQKKDYKSVLRNYCDDNYMKLLHIWGGQEYEDLKKFYLSMKKIAYKCVGNREFNGVFSDLYSGKVPKKIYNVVGRENINNPEKCLIKMEELYKPFAINSLLVLVIPEKFGLNFDQAFKKVMYNELLLAIIREIPDDFFGYYPNLWQDVENNVNSLKEELDSKPFSEFNNNIISKYASYRDFFRNAEKLKEKMLGDKPEDGMRNNYLRMIKSYDLKNDNLYSRGKYKSPYLGFNKLLFSQIVNYPSVKDKEFILDGYLMKQSQKIRSSRNRVSSLSNKDKRKAIKDYIEKYPKCTNNKIATILGVAPKTVKKVRENLSGDTKNRLEKADVLDFLPDVIKNQYCLVTTSNLAKVHFTRFGDSII